MPIEDIRILAQRYEGDPNNDTNISSKDHLEYCDKDDINKLIIATIRLHLCPGINPHTGGQCSPIKLLIVKTPITVTPYWWTSPDLMSDKDGAKVVMWRDEIIFMNAEINSISIQQAANEAASELFNNDHYKSNKKEKIKITAFIHEDYKEYVDVNNLSSVEVEIDAV